MQGTDVFPQKAQDGKWSLTQSPSKLTLWTCDMCRSLGPYLQTGPVLGLMLCYHHHETCDFHKTQNLSFLSEVWWDNSTHTWEEEKGQAAAHTHRGLSPDTTDGSRLHSWPVLPGHMHLSKARLWPCRALMGQLGWNLSPEWWWQWWQWPWARKRGRDSTWSHAGTLGRRPACSSPWKPIPELLGQVLTFQPEGQARTAGYLEVNLVNKQPPKTYTWTLHNKVHRELLYLQERVLILKIPVPLQNE